MAEEVSIIHEHALFFDDILECIPASLYLQPIDENNPQWKKHFKKNSNAEKIQEMKEIARKKRKAKFHPAADTTMVEKIKERKIQEEDVEDVEISPDHPTVVPIPAKSMDELRDRLRAKIDALKSNRIEADENNKSKQSKNKQSAKREHDRESKDSANKKIKLPDNQTVVSADADETSSTAPSINDVISNIQFGKIRSPEEVDTSLRPKVKKDIHTLLKQAQKKQEYLKQLKASDNGQKEAENLEWANAIGKAEGFKKKDNPTLLRKTMKKQQQQKKKSQGEWQGRKNNEKKQLKMKQNKNRPGFEGKNKEFLNRNEKRGGAKPSDKE